MDTDIVKNETRERGRTKREKVMHLLGFLVLLGGLGYGLITYFGSKSLGTITASPPPSVSEPTSLTEGKKRFEGKSATFFYPASFREKPTSSEVKKPLLEGFFAMEDGVTARRIAYLAEEESVAPIEELSAYQFRLLEKKVYFPEKIKRNGLNITLFTKHTPVFEVGAFFKQQQKSASLVVSSPTSIEGLRELLLGVLDSLTDPR